MLCTRVSCFLDSEVVFFTVFAAGFVRVLDSSAVYTGCGIVSKLVQDIAIVSGGVIMIRTQTDHHDCSCMSL